jgi:hypothetical protein
MQGGRKMANVILALKFNNEIVGYRALLSNGTRYDVDIDTIASLGGIDVANVTKFANLFDHNGLLLSRIEIDSGVRAMDISGNTKLVKDIFLTKSESSTIVAKGQKYLQFTNGLSIILRGIEEENSEYQTLSTTFDLYLVFKTKKAITEVASILGSRFNKTSTLENFARGRTSIGVKLDSYTYHMLLTGFNANAGLVKEGFNLHTSNHYSGERVHVQVVPPHFREALAENIKHTNVGTTADGDSLEQFVQVVIARIALGTYTLYPSISFENIKRL